MTPVKENVIKPSLPRMQNMTVCVQAFASQQRTVRCHDTETSATEINRSHKNGAFSELA